MADLVVATCQTYSFWADRGELVLVPQGQKEDAVDESKQDDGDDLVWIDVSLTNFTGRIVVRPKRKESNIAVTPPRNVETNTINEDTDVTPVHRNDDAFYVESQQQQQQQQQQEVPNSPPYAETSAMGFAVVDNASLTIATTATSSSSSSSSIPPSPPPPLKTPPLLNLPMIAESPSSDHEIDYREDIGVARRKRFASRDDENSVDNNNDRESGSFGMAEPERAGTNCDDFNFLSSLRMSGGVDFPSDEAELAAARQRQTGTESDPETLSLGQSNHSESENDQNNNGSESSSNKANSLNESSHQQRGRLTSSLSSRGEGGQRRSSSLQMRRGPLRQTAAGAASGSSELFQRAVNLFSKSKVGGEGKGRVPPSKIVSTGDLSQNSDSGTENESDRITEMRGPTTSDLKKQHSRTASWGAMMQVYAVKKHVPATIRQKRIDQRRSLNLDNQASSASMFPTRLHELCAEPDATLSELIECLDANKSAATKKDKAGKLPLHILGDNEALVGTAPGKQVASSFALKLMEANPEAITMLDNEGYMPFVKLIADWVSYVYESHRNYRRAKLAASPNIFHRGNVNSSEVVTNRDISSNVFFARKTDGTGSTTRLFPKPEVWDEVEWCFSMLSLEMDELAGKSDILFRTTRRDVFATIHVSDPNHQPHVKKPDLMRKEIICHLISAMPELLKTVLLIETEGGETRRRILKMSVFRRMFLCRECIGDWLTQMLRKTGSASRRAVDFLELISGTTVSDYTGGYKATTVDDATKYHEERQDVYEAVNNLEGTIGSLVTMENRQTERAAATGVIWHIMGDRLARPFVLGLVLVDLVLHISLMVAFRNNVQISNSNIGEISTQSVLFICSHYLIRKGCEALALLTISPSVFRGYFTNVWTLFDLMAIILTMVAFVWNTKNPGTYRNGFNAFVVGLLWMKVVSFLKVVNKDMSTFILALLEILSDIKYFLVVLVVVIFMFGDMFHLAVSTKDDGEFCKTDDLEGPTQDFCNRQLTSSYLRVYSILLGDFELNDLQDTTSITTLYVIFTSIGVVILLNVLIAVIADSYEKATVSSAMLFGRARVTFVAQNEALEAFLKPGVNPMQAFRGIFATRTFLSRLFTLFRWFVLLAIIATACDTAVFLVILSIDAIRAQGSRDPSFLTAALLFVMFCILASSLGVLIGFAFEGLVYRLFPSPIWLAFDRMNQFNVSLVRWLAFRLFGLHTRRHHDPKGADDWSGRLNYMEGMFEKIVEDAKKDLITEMAALETRLYEHDLANREIDQEESGAGRVSKRNLMTFPMRRNPAAR